LSVPAGTANGSYFVGAQCTNGDDQQNYEYTPFTVGPAPASPGGGTVGPPGPQGNPGTNGTNGTNGAAGKNGTNGTNAASPTASTTKCTTTLTSLTVTTTTCTVKYTYSASESTDLRNGARAQATATVGGRTVVVATGRVRGHRLRLTFQQLKRGHYKLTLWQLRGHAKREVIGHTSPVIS
jgi:hypothetical protein